MMQFTTYGPWACVTGASDGIGRAFAEQLAQAGLHLVLVARQQEKLQALATALTQQHGIQTHIVALDLSVPGASLRLQNAIADVRIGLYVLAAGFGSAGAFLQQPLANEVNMLQLNCQAVLEQTHLFGQQLAQQQRGGLILFSSLLAFQGTPFSTHYAATKAYIQSLGEGLAVELKPAGVDVLLVAPGPIHTGFAARAGMRMSQALTPQVVAAQSLRVLGKRTTIRPGWLSKLLGWSLAMAPRWLAVSIIGRIMQGMAPAPNH